MKKTPCVEDFKLMAMYPYGRTRLFLEEFAQGIQKAEPERSIILLRYFNPAGELMRVVNLVRNIPRVSQAITCPTYNKYLVADFLSLMYAVMTIPQRMVMAHLENLLTR
ncbi:hypothetical protein POTOM_004377 [Populus tomentosa]|uniref:Uncharacterized protein n=1 Tax=Populus tomentosa TaxID=118781 RepID=A0A8X8AQE8_POPTO|nr:hypothetical protein POTOM_004377 [Populus tomentosa]